MCIGHSQRFARASSKQGSKEETCETWASSPEPTVRITGPMRMAMLGRGRMTHPLPETLIPHALGGGDPATARHVEGCSTCRAEVARLRDAVGPLRASVSLERRSETAACLDELTIADLVVGRLAPETRGPVVAHLLSCAPF